MNYMKRRNSSCARIIAFAFIFLFTTYLVSLPAKAQLGPAIYYVNASGGNDGNDGSTPATAWQTINKLNSRLFQPGDTILFKRDEVWREQLTLSSSGTDSNPITIGAYGSGANPLIKRTEYHSDDNWSLYYDQGGKKIWTTAYSLPEDLAPRSILEDGNRRTGVYISNSSNPETVLENLTCGPWKGKLYYRKDSAAPQNTEIGSRRFGIYTNGKSNIVIDSIDVAGPSASVSSLDARSLIYTSKNSRNITVRNLELCLADGLGISDGEQSGTTISGAVNLVYQNLTVSDCQSTGIYHRGSGKIQNCISHSNGLLLHDEGDRGGIGIQGGNILVEGCEVYNIGRMHDTVDFAISIWEPIGTITIRRNYIHNITSGAVQVYGNSNGGNYHEISYNLIDTYGYTDYDSGASGKTAGIRIQYSEGVKIFNNVIARGGTSATTQAIFLRYAAPATRIFNNIFYRNSNPDLWIYPGTDISGLASDYNLFYKDDYTDNWFFETFHGSDNLSQWQLASEQDFHSMVGNPQLKEYIPTSPEGFELQSGSIAIDAGMELGSDKDFGNRFVPQDGDANGTALPDIGIFEYPSPTFDIPAPAFPNNLSVTLTDPADIK
jgi:hypothetical protein